MKILIEFVSGDNKPKHGEAELMSVIDIFSKTKTKTNFSANNGNVLSIFPASTGKVHLFFILLSYLILF